MNKRVIIIDGLDESVGTTADVENYKKFFYSLWGGFWNEDEIKVIRGTTADDVRIRLRYATACQPDYCICIFAGHGDMRRSDGCTQIYLHDGTFIDERELYGSSKKQLTILDCCREYEDMGVLITESVKRCHVKSAASAEFRNFVREKYEERIMNAVMAQYTLYACSINHVAHGDSILGGQFSHALINSYADWSEESNEEFLTINEAFLIARDKCLRDTKNPQLPVSYLPRCMRNRSIIWAINAKYAQNKYSQLLQKCSNVSKIYRI